MFAAPRISAAAFRDAGALRIQARGFRHGKFSHGGFRHEVL
jgi:hypothetical protein